MRCGRSTLPSKEPVGQGALERLSGLNHRAMLPARRTGQKAPAKSLLPYGRDFRQAENWRGTEQRKPCSPNYPLFLVRPHCGGLPVFLYPLRSGSGVIISSEHFRRSAQDCSAYTVFISLVTVKNISLP